MAKEYIERDAAERVIRETSTLAFTREDVIQRLSAIPTADVVEVVHGRWEYLQDDEWRCSNCHTVFNTGGKWIPMTDNFCSECGADMRERRDNDAAD